MVRAHQKTIDLRDKGIIRISGKANEIDIESLFQIVSKLNKHPAIKKQGISIGVKNG
jgi:hypothetical protein